MKVRTFIELPLSQFRALFPEQAERIPTCFDLDPLYIVRYDLSRGLIEFGYKEDKWLVQ
jgi:hypothetical protein